MFYLYYNKNYLRALKLSTITDKIVNKEVFKGGELLFWIDMYSKQVCHYPIISNYLRENYSKTYSKSCNLLIEVINEYEEYKDYKYW